MDKSDLNCILLHSIVSCFRKNTSEYDTRQTANYLGRIVDRVEHPVCPRCRRYLGSIQIFI